MELRFSNQDLRKLIVPLVIEQFLQFSAGLISSIMVAGLGEDAVSAVSLVDSVFILFIMMFSALATGGAVVAGQLIGLGDLKKGCQAAWQMILFVGLASVAVMGLCYLGHNFILDTVFGDITPEVRQNAKTFLLITNEDERGKGNGVKLMDHAKELAKERGCKALVLDSGMPRTQAHRFYEIYGFEKSCYGFDYYL